MNNLLEGKRALVTGVGPDIGRSIALEMAGQGAAVYFVDINQEHCDRMQRELDEAGATGRGWVIDISDPASIDQLLAALKKADTHIDILVNNVGVNSSRRGVQDQTAENWLRVLNTNIVGPMHLTHAITQQMIEAGNGGSVIFLSSVHQWWYKGDPLYSGSKAAISKIVDELAVKLAQYNIRVNSIAPGFVSTRRDGQPYESPGTPLHRESIKPKYIGRAAVYLASDYFSYCTTGTTLKIDAGLSLANFMAPKAPRQD